MQLTYIATTRAQRNVQPDCFAMQYHVFIQHLFSSFDNGFDTTYFPAPTPKTASYAG